MYSQSTRLSPEKMLKQAQRTKGYLLKKSSGFLGNWDRRYFLISGGKLSYFPDETLEKLKGSISLNEALSITMRGLTDFMLQTPSRNYEFRCERQSDRDLWVASLNIVKEFLSNGGSSKKFIIKSDKSIKSCPKLKQKCLGDVRQVLELLKLKQLLDEVQEPRVYNRICCCRDQNYFYISISVKSLQSPEEDEQILAEKYITPFQFNKFYRVDSNGQYEDFGKVSQMLSFTTNHHHLVITISENRKLLIPYEDESLVDEISRRLCRSYEVAKEYYNPFKIILKKNVDRLVFLYQNHPQVFEEQVRYRTVEALKRYTNESHNPVSVFLEDLRNVKRSLVETEQALRVMNPPRQKVKAAYFKICHEVVYKQLSQAWESLHQHFQLQDYLKLASEIYEYWVVTNLVVGDLKLLEGCIDLNKFYLRKHGDNIKALIENVNYSKLESRKIRNEPLSNEITSTFFGWLHEFTKTLSESVPVEAVFDEFCKFFTRSFEELCEYLTEVSDKWTETPVLVGACNDIVRIKRYLLKEVGPELCNGITAETRFHNICSNNIVSRLNDTLGYLIRRIFVVVFGSIDKKILNRPFLEIDIAKICYEVLQRLEPFKNKVIEEVDDEIIMLSFDEICFFFYTCLMKKRVPQVKNVRQLCILAIEKALMELEQYYCNIKTEEKVKKHLKEYMLLKEILACPDNFLIKYAINLRQVFGSSFNEDSIYVILKLRQTPEENFQKFSNQCCEGIKQASSSDDSVSRSSQDQMIRSRKSTLTESLYGPNATEMVTYAKHKRQGPLLEKKVSKGVPIYFSESYFRIKQTKLIQFSSASSYEPISSINLTKVDNVYLENNGGSTFVVVLGTDKYYFSAKSRDEAGLWVQAIYSEIGQPLYENKESIIPKDKRDCLFKNFEAEMATTATLRVKPFENEEESKVLQLKRMRRLKDAQNRNQKKEASPRKHEKMLKPASQSPARPRKSKREDEGTCCSRTFL